MPRETLAPMALVEPIYNRQPDESDKGFAKFVFFRELGPSRTKDAVAKEFEITPARVAQLGMRGQWDFRVREWDQHLDERRQETAIDTVEEMSARHAKAANAGIELAVEVIEATSKEDVTLGEATRLLDTSVKIERLSRGASTSNILIQMEAVLVEITAAAISEIPAEYRARVVDKMQRVIDEKVGRGDQPAV